MDLLQLYFNYTCCYYFHIHLCYWFQQIPNMYEYRFYLCICSALVISPLVRSVLFLNWGGVVDRPYFIGWKYCDFVIKQGFTFFFGWVNKVSLFSCHPIWYTLKKEWWSETQKVSVSLWFVGMVEKEMEDPSLEVIRKWIKGLSDGTKGQQLETSTTKGIRLVKAHKGFILCDLIIHSGLLVINL